MISSILLIGLLAFTPYVDVDPFSSSTTSPALYRFKSYPNAGLHFLFRGIGENIEIDPHKEKREYEQWYFFGEATPYLSADVTSQHRLLAGVRMVQNLGGKPAFAPRITFADDATTHTLLFGNFRRRWSDGILYQPLAADDFMGSFLRIGNQPVQFEAVLSRIHAAADLQYEEFIVGSRLRLQPHKSFVFDIQGLIDHAAGFDTAGIKFRRPAEPTFQINQFGAHTAYTHKSGFGIHAEVERSTGKAVWMSKTWKPAGYFREAGLNYYKWGGSGRLAYRRVDHNFVGPQGAYAYRFLYPLDRRPNPDEVFARFNWGYDFHDQVSLFLEVEQNFFIPRNFSVFKSNQNRASSVLEVRL